MNGHSTALQQWVCYVMLPSAAGFLSASLIEQIVPSTLFALTVIVAANVVLLYDHKK